MTDLTEPGQTELLIIGAGPFGLSVAAYCQHLGIDYRIVGRPMGFWKSDMPGGMILRSDCDWHLDPLDIHTLEEFASTLGYTRDDVEPLAINFYLNYTQWFQDQKQIVAEPVQVSRLDRFQENGGQFAATLSDGQQILTRKVVLAVGFQYFKHIPAAVANMLPPDCYTHTCDLVDFKHLDGKRCLIIGGRQAAFEWAALIHEIGAEQVHVVYRHDTPALEPSDWTWVMPILDNMVEHPSWFRELTPEQQDELNRRFWAEGRLKIEPWLAPRILVDGINLWPNTRITGCDTAPGKDLKIKLDNDETLAVDQVIFATGYRVDLNRIPFLAAGNLQPQIELLNGYPVLDTHFQSTVPGLFITSMPATQDFGGFFAFTAAVRTSAKLIGQALNTS